MRRLIDHGFTLLTGMAALAACGLLVGIAAVILERGLPALSWEFVSRAADGFGGGGVVYQIAGTVLLLLTALGVAAPTAIAVALLATVYLDRGRSRRRLTLALYALNGVPSIVFGIVGLAVFVKGLGWGKSWLAGGLVLALMILPTLTVALAERIRAVPRSYRTAASGLGLSRSAVVWSVLLPQSLGGLVSGTLLGLARAAGETAPILFTAAVFAGATLPAGVKESPILALPYHIFVLAQDSFDPAAGAALWGSATVLLALVLSLSIAALPTRLRTHEEARHG